MSLLFPAGQQFGDSNLDPVGAGKLYVYDNGTTNEASIYSNPALSSSLSNPVVLDASGRSPSNIYAAPGTSFTIKLETSDDAEVFSRDNIWGIPVGDALYASGNGAVEAIASARFGIGADIAAAGASSMSRTMAGVELTAEGMSTSAKYAPPIKFMSTDSSFTTENPKFLAAITGEAIESYNADNNGGMALVFFATGTTPGANNVPTEAFRIHSSNVRIPTFLRYSGTPQTLSGAGAVNLTTAVTHVATTGANALSLADGNDGQVKYIVMTVDNGAGTLTPTSLANGSTITFDDVGDSAHLLFTNSAWHFMGGTATLA